MLCIVLLFCHAGNRRAWQLKEATGDDADEDEDEDGPQVELSDPMMGFAFNECNFIRVFYLKLLKSVFNIIPNNAFALLHLKLR